MWKVYLKQIRYLLKENKFFSVVYIVGTALSITMVMLILMVYHIKTGNIGVENKRDRMLYVTKGYALRHQKASGYCCSFLNAGMVEKWFYHLKPPEAVTMVGRISSVVYNERSQRNEVLSSIFTDAGFWKVHSMRFLCGRAFNEAEVKGKMQRVVIDESTARRLFGEVNVEGRSLSIDWKEYKICGVIEDVPSYLSNSAARIYYPYTTTPNSTEDWGTDEVPLGQMSLYFLLRSTKDEAKLRQELDHQIELMNKPNVTWFFSLKEQPSTALEVALRMGNTDEGEELATNRLYVVLIILGILLIVPALNLAGLIVARMKKRGEEIGIRKAFGASTGSLMFQMLLENFFQMLLGGVLGLFLSAGLFQCVRASLLVSMDNFLIGAGLEEVSSLSFWHVVDVSTVCYVLILCFVLNLISTLLPAWRYTRKSIVEALNRK